MTGTIPSFDFDAAVAGVRGTYAPPKANAGDGNHDGTTNENGGEEDLLTDAEFDAWMNNDQPIKQADLFGGENGAEDRSQEVFSEKSQELIEADRPSESTAADQDHSEKLQDVHDAFAAFGRREHLPENLLGVALEFVSMVPSVPATVAATHSFKNPDDLTDDDQRFFDALGNLAHERGLSQTDVETIIGFYQKMRGIYGDRQNMITRATTKAMAAIEAQDLKDRDKTRDLMREEWGNEYDANVAAINQALDNMNETRRGHYEDRDANNRLRLNDPAVLTELARLARNETPSTLKTTMQQTGQTERTALESMMADRRSAYWRGPDAAQYQARYRDLIRDHAPTEKELPFSDSSVASEIADIEKTMRTNPRAYFKDEALQARYRNLLDRRQRV